MSVPEFSQLLAACKSWGDCLVLKQHGNGHINHTLYGVFQGPGGLKKVILQQVNTKIFKNPRALMENISRVTAHIQKKVEEAGGDASREALHLLPFDSGEVFWEEGGRFWRAYDFIDNTLCLDLAENPEEFAACGAAFGKFQRQLSDFDAASLHETLPDFHNTKKRLQDFKMALDQDLAGRRKRVEGEIDFILSRERYADYFPRERERGMPLRVTHNDTKLNNVLLDAVTKKAVCIIDLDTVMPGFAAHDFGDSIRFGASTALEDERDLHKVSCSMELFRAYAKGFIVGCQGGLTKAELAAMPMGAIVMTYECGMRFLADYLEGDIYFKTSRPEHNLDRARTQLKLVEDMEAKMERMQEGIRQILGEE